MTENEFKITYDDYKRTELKNRIDDFIKFGFEFDNGRFDINWFNENVYKQSHKLIMEFIIDIDVYLNVNITLSLYNKINQKILLYKFKMNPKEKRILNYD